MHIKQIYLYALSCCIVLSFFACSSDKKDKDFEGVGKLIASRNSARYKKAEQSKKRKIKKEPLKVQNQDQSIDQKGDVAGTQVKKKPAKKKFSSEIFYEEEIKIVSASSDNTLGVGTAYLNKDGKIVQIKIKRN
ncbi:MAG: hypothetical protein GY707_08165 [Desulfobacteraceae bacterium]|nr:hypothetical protein [Desulfobacteraceae bacterium]